MKSIRRAILGNQEYHHNLLGEEFEGLIKEATDKNKLRPDAQANRNVASLHSVPQHHALRFRSSSRSTIPILAWN